MDFSVPIGGFQHQSAIPLAALSATTHLFRHEKTGAEPLWLDRPSDNKTFAVSFLTLPEQEGWHYKLEPDGNPSYVGVVFGEVKGAVSLGKALVVCSVSSLQGCRAIVRQPLCELSCAPSKDLFSTFVSWERRFSFQSIE